MAASTQEPALWAESMAQGKTVQFQWLHGRMEGSSVHRSRKTFADMRPMFLCGDSSELPGHTEMYSVEWFGSGYTSSEGGLLFGCTRLQPGTVEDEYFMTHGHFHANRTRDEVYLPVAGSGLLLRMDEGGRSWAEPMSPGVALAISGRHAHRVVNCGDVPLVFWACWPADAGYDYVSIAHAGFGCRVFRQDGEPALIMQAARCDREAQ